MLQVMMWLAFIGFFGTGAITYYTEGMPKGKLRTVLVHVCAPIFMTMFVVGFVTGMGISE